MFTLITEDSVTDHGGQVSPDRKDTRDTAFRVPLRTVQAPATCRSRQNQGCSPRQPWARSAEPPTGWRCATRRHQPPSDERRRRPHSPVASGTPCAEKPTPLFGPASGTPDLARRGRVISTRRKGPSPAPSASRHWSAPTGSSPAGTTALEAPPPVTRQMGPRTQLAIRDSAGQRAWLPRNR